MKLSPIVAAVILAALAGCARAPREPVGDVIRISVTEAGFEPAETIIPAGRPVTLEVTRKTDQTCATEMVFASTGARHDLPLNRAVRIPLEAGAGDTLRYACGMDMFRGTIIAR